MATEKFTSIDDYIASFPEQTRVILEEIRARLRHAVPDGVEAISYQIPTIKVDGRNLVHFAGWTQHVSVYPVPATNDRALKNEIARYQVSKGTLKFPHGKPVPYDFIERVVDALLDQRDAQ